MSDLVNSINSFVGKDIREVTIWQVVIRAALTYFFTILLVRWGHKRFMGQSTAFDAVLGFILGSVASRAVNGNAPFVQCLVAASVLVFLHWIVSYMIYRLGDGVANVFQGRSTVLVRDGRMDEAAMRLHSVTKQDLIGALRQWGNIDLLDEVKLATLERSGQISCVVRKSGELLRKAD